MWYNWQVGEEPNLTLMAGNYQTVLYLVNVPFQYQQYYGNAHCDTDLHLPLLKWLIWQWDEWGYCKSFARVNLFLHNNKLWIGDLPLFPNDNTASIWEMGLFHINLNYIGVHLIKLKIKLFLESSEMVDWHTSFT